MAGSKKKTQFSCTECGHVEPKWFGRCAACGAWNTAAEEVLEAETKHTAALQRPAARNEPQPIHEITTEDTVRLPCGYAEADRVLGGGIVPGAALLLGGEPGVGKSTLLLQIAGQIASQHGQVLYLSGEESPEQIRMRAERVKAIHPELKVKSESSVESMIADIRAAQPFLAIVDSIQTTAWSELGSAPGSVAQVRDCGSLLVRLAKETGTPIVIVGHVTKDGQIAGPRLLEHLVDVVLYFEGDRHQLYRILRGAKNRFGSTNEIGLFEMGSQGLQEVTHPAAIFAGRGGERAPGSVVTVTLEGNRPLLIEVQALVAPYHGHGFPRRATSGVDNNRLAMILAVLEKRLHIPLGNRDIFVNVTGGISLSEPAGDLGIAAAILSSYYDEAVPTNGFVFGELGLSGEIRPVRGCERRIHEARQLGYPQGLIPDGNARELRRGGIQIDGLDAAARVEEMHGRFFTQTANS